MGIRRLNTAIGTGSIYKGQAIIAGTIGIIDIRITIAIVIYSVITVTTLFNGAAELAFWIVTIDKAISVIIDTITAILLSKGRTGKEQSEYDQ